MGAACNRLLASLGIVLLSVTIAPPRSHADPQSRSTPQTSRPGSPQTATAPPTRRVEPSRPTPPQTQRTPPTQRADPSRRPPPQTEETPPTRRGSPAQRLPAPDQRATQVPQICEVPDLGQRQPMSARAALEDRRLRLGQVHWVDSDRREPGIFKQLPNAGARVRCGTSVNVWVAGPSDDVRPSDNRRPDDGKVTPTPADDVRPGGGRRPDDGKVTPTPRMMSGRVVAEDRTMARSRRLTMSSRVVAEDRTIRYARPSCPGSSAVA